MTLKTIRVGPLDINVGSLSGEDRDSNLGTYTTSELTIRLRDKFASDQQHAETLLHELLHAVWHVYGVKIKEGEERTVGLLSIALTGVIRDNPGLIAWLTKALK